MNTDFAHYNEEQLRKLGELHSLLRHSDIGSSYLASLPEPRSVEELNPPQEINVTHSEMCIRDSHWAVIPAVSTPTHTLPDPVSPQ